jgi:pyridoxal phosphate enzyme (YggS family)
MIEPDVRKNLQSIENDLAPFHARLLPVSKTFPPEIIQKAYEAGYREFGENKVQELLEKKEALPSDIQWHLIGHLQTNKVKYIASFVHLIHSVDSEKLLAEIDKQAAKAGRVVSVLLQVYIAKEETKFGWDAHELTAWFKENGPSRFPNVRILGLMGMASNSSDLEQVRSEFRSLKNIFDSLKQETSFPNVEMTELSMGMSGDFRIACEEGSTLVRMGSSVFGTR